ncbi:MULTISPECIES: conjugal transfer protein TraA [Sinorhizobium]|uniref:conjugal transfer protein TraA n=1 Tax=Sinorhizobium TaxID=28105 RepID=UPI000BE90FFD|nr:MULTISPECIES: conjugal transfer protein TraA [Sinorhizobium]PDT50827.1 conjugal transfer protein TraA [Sinorhizobium sp. NG07B]POH24948.1 conjugal transfer protein TraA [Sinorhizobium americanum]
MEIFFGAFTSEWEQRRAALLHEMSSGGRGASAEEEMRKRLKQLAQLGAAGGGGGSSGASGARGSASKGRGAHRAQVTSATTVARPMEARLAAVAKGSQPAVVKMASYGGGARVGAMLNYVSRGGELKVENESGRILEGREELARIRADWDHLFQNRAESRDIGSFSVEIAASGFASDEGLHEQVRSTLTSGFGDRRYAYAIAKNEGGSLTVQGLVVLRSGQGERLTGDAKAAGIIQGRYDISSAAGEAAAKFSFHGYGNGVEFGASRLRGLVDRHDVRDDRGQPIGNEKVAGDLVQKEWRSELHSRRSRDVMHVIMSARAGTDVAAFEGAVRDFLAHQFAGHRYVFAMHDPASDPKEAGEGGKRPHVHAHAIVAMKSDSGDRIETTPAVFREWRSVMAEKAREHGIEMEMTDRREFASPPAFTRTQVRPMSREGRTEHVGTSEAAQARYDAKRSGRRTVAKSDRSRQYAKTAQETWQKIALVAGDRQTVAYATEHRAYLETGLSAVQMQTSATIIHADFGSNFRANLVTLQEMVLEGQELRETSRAEFEAYEKKVETALFKLERTVAPEDRADFDEVAGLARDFVNQKRELVGLYEQRKEALSEQSGEETRDPVNDKRDAAVAKHGEAAVEAGNEAMIEIEHYREGLDRIEDGEFSTDRKDGFQNGLNQAMERAAQLAVQGNSYIREVAEHDPDLQRAIDQTENKSDRPQEAKDKAPIVDALDEQQRDLRADEEDRQPSDNDAREAHDLASTVDATNRLQDRLNKDREAAQGGGETTRTDPAQQHIPRLEEIEREQIEQKERDRDDRDR